MNKKKKTKKKHPVYNKTKKTYIKHKKYSKKYHKKRSSKTKKHYQKGGFDENKACQAGFAYNWSPFIKVDNTKLIKQYNSMSPKIAPRAAITKPSQKVLENATVGIVPELAGLNPNEFKIEKNMESRRGSECGDWAWIENASNWKPGGKDLVAYRYKNNGEDAKYKFCSKKGKGVLTVKCPEIVDIKQISGDVYAPISRGSKNWENARNKQLSMNATNNYGYWLPVGRTWESPEAIEDEKIIKEGAYEKNLRRLEFFATIAYSTSVIPDTRKYALTQTTQLITKLKSSKDKKKEKEVNDVISNAKGEAAYYKIYQKYMKETYQDREKEMNTERKNAIESAKKNPELMKEIEREARYASDEITGSDPIELERKQEVYKESIKDAIRRKGSFAAMQVEMEYQEKAAKEAEKEKNKIIYIENLKNKGWKKSDAETYGEDLHRKLDLLKKILDLNTQQAENLLENRFTKKHKTSDAANNEFNEFIEKETKKLQGTQETKTQKLTEANTKAEEAKKALEKVSKKNKFRSKKKRDEEIKVAEAAVKAAEEAQKLAMEAVKKGKEVIEAAQKTAVNMAKKAAETAENMAKNAETTAKNMVA